MGLKRKSSSKSPPVFSHEFVIQNHADIVSCIAMVFVCGLMFQATAPFASMFMAISHNLTSMATTSDPAVPILYTYGLKDFCMIFFYFLICIVMHAIIQEYILDKVNRKMHLSKVKHSKCNESGQLLIFYLISILWGGDIVLRENYFLNVSQLWEGYPFHQMTFMFKFFFIVQLCYWLHCFPELYFQKTKKEEMVARITYPTLYLTFLSVAYVLNFTRLALCLVLMNYIAECVFHAARLLYFAEKTSIANIAFNVYNVGFVLFRLGSITLSVLTFWYGLALSEHEGINLETGNFNTQTIRINCLLSVCLVQAWMMWNFITFHLKRLREQSVALSKKKQSLKNNQKKQKRDDDNVALERKTRTRAPLLKGRLAKALNSKNANKKLQRPSKRNSEEDVSELPEVDQNTKRDLRARTSTSSRGRKFIH